MNRDDVLGLARAAGFDEDRSIVGERPAQMLSRNEYVAEPVFRHEFIARHIDVLVRFADMVAVRIAAHSPPPPLVVSLSDIDQAQLAAMLAKAPAMPLVAAPDDSKLAVCFNQIKSDLIADGAVEHDLRLEFFPEAVLDAFRRQRAARQEAQAMAECLDMLRTDLIAAEVIGPDVAPMFLTEAVMAAVSRERTARIEAQQRLADAQDLMSKSGLAHRKAVQEAVREVREECAKEFDALADEAEADSDPSALVGLYRSKAASIRERGAPPVAPALCCDGGPQWGHAWDCPTLP